MSNHEERFHPLGPLTPPSKHKGSPMNTIFRARASASHPDTYHLQMEVHSGTGPDSTIIKQRSMGVIRRKSQGWELSLTWNPNFPEQRVSTHATIAQASEHFVRELVSLREDIEFTQDDPAVVGLEK